TAALLLFFFDSPPISTHYTLSPRRSSDLKVSRIFDQYEVRLVYKDSTDQIQCLLRSRCDDHVFVPDGMIISREPRRNPITKFGRSEEHTSELQSPYDLVCRLLLEKKKLNQ